MLLSYPSTLSCYFPILVLYDVTILLRYYPSTPLYHYSYCCVVLCGVGARGSGRNVKRFRGGLVSKAHGCMYHETLGSRVAKTKEGQGNSPSLEIQGYLARKKPPPPLGPPQDPRYDHTAVSRGEAVSYGRGTPVGACSRGSAVTCSSQFILQFLDVQSISDE